MISKAIKTMGGVGVTPQELQKTVIEWEGVPMEFAFLNMGKMGGGGRQYVKQTA